MLIKYHIPKKESYGIKYSFKYFIEILYKTSTNDKNVTMRFRVNNKQLLKKYNKILGKVEKLLNINFESKPVYGDDDDKFIIYIYAIDM